MDKLQKLEELLKLGLFTISQVQPSLTQTEHKKLLLFSTMGATHCYAEAALTLFRVHQAKASYVLLRSIFEAYTTIKYIYSDDTDEHAVRYILNDEKEAGRLVQKMLDLHQQYPITGSLDINQLTAVQQKNQKAINEIKGGHAVSDKGLPDLYSRAVAVDKFNRSKKLITDSESPLAWAYLHVYWLLSLSAHLGSKGLSGFMEPKEEGGYDFILDGKPDELERAIVTAYGYYLGVLQMFCSEFQEVNATELTTFQEVFQQWKPE